MQEVIAQFHWLRPAWLLALVPAVVLVALLWRYHGQTSRWQQVIAPEMLRVLLDRQRDKASRWPLVALLGAWVLTTVALAGPAWEKLPQPVKQLQSGVVVLWDLSPSMLAKDVKPSRLVRSRYKLTDYLNARDEGLTGLVAYAGEAHVISPLTDDTNTIINLLPALEPDIMPLQGSNIEMAADLGVELLQDSGLAQGELLVVTDGIAPAARSALVQRLGATPYRLSILGVGTDNGAPIPTGSAGFVKDDNNNIVIAKLNSAALQQLADRLGGVYVGLQPDNTDVNYLQAATDAANEAQARQRQVEREFDTWHDAGQYIALLLLPFVALAFRRGWVVGLCIIGTGVTQPQPALAFEWEDLWLRGDQQGQQAMHDGNAEKAVEEFTRPDWKGTALYRNQNYAAAAEKFSEWESADAHYNRGNALAKAGELEQAIAAYDQALEQNPDMEDARYNRDLVQQLLDRQQQQQAQHPNQDGEPQDEEGEQQQAQNDQQNQQQNEQNQAGQQNQQAESGDDQNIDEERAQELAQRDQANQQQGDQQQAQADQAGEQNNQSEQQNHEQTPQTVEAQRAEESDAEPEEDPSPAYAQSQQESTSEEQQALEQWLRQIPDDPSGLLRRKLEFQHRQLRQRYRTGEWEPPDNEAYERW